MIIGQLFLNGSVLYFKKVKRSLNSVSHVGGLSIELFKVGKENARIIQ